MKLVCAPETFAFPAGDDALHVVLYGQPGRPDRGSAGASARYDILQAGLEAAPRAWDLLSLALSVVTADLAGLRDRSPDGWTREFELDVTVADPAFWSTQTSALEAALGFLTTDRCGFASWKAESCHRRHADRFVPTRTAFCCYPVASTA